MSLNISFDDVIIAYKKAKVDAYFETGHLTAVSFADYEQSLFENLESLYERLLSNNTNWLKRKSFVGGYTIILKSVTDSNKLDLTKQNEFIYYSDSQRNPNNSQNFNLDYRLIGQHPVDFHILSSLWIEKVGYKLEKVISKNSYGCRLKRDYEDPIDLAEKNENEEGSIRFSLGHFRPYFKDYKNWQERGIDAIEKALSQDKKIIAVTADIKKYYHRIDPSFLLESEFLSELGLEEYEDSEKFLTEYLVDAIVSWSKRIYLDEEVPDFFKINKHCGIPIGLGASKVIANLLLSFLDKQIQNELKPIYYGRYVDDIFIVLEDSGTINCRKELWNFIEKRIEWIKNKENTKDGSFEIPELGPTFEIPFSPRSLLRFEMGKEKLFILEGTSGVSFIETLKETLNENSSEWRLLPDEEKDLKSLANEMAKASSTSDEPVNGLRKSDGISIQRMKFVLYLKHFEVLVELLPKSFWGKGLQKFYSLSLDFVISHDKIATFLKYYPSLIKLAIRADEPRLAIIAWKRINLAWNLLSQKNSDTSDLLFEKAKGYCDKLLIEAVISSFNIEYSDSYKLSEWEKLFLIAKSSLEEISENSNQLFYSDLHSIPFKRILQEGRKTIPWENIKQIFSNFDELKYLDEDIINISGRKLFLRKTFLAYQNNTDPIILPYSLFFYTRPFSTLEITQMFSEWTSVKGLKQLQKFLGLFNIPFIDAEISPNLSVEPELRLSQITQINIADGNDHLDRVFALTSFQTNDNSWIAWVRDDGAEPDSDRYSRLFRLVNEVISCDQKKINYLVLPELSIPRSILLYIASKLKTKAISLIAGVEYEKKSVLPGYPTPVKGFVSNQLIYILNSRTKSSLEQVYIKQEKVIPAIHEETELFNVGGKLLVATDERKFLINHGGFFFCGFICNDLLDINNRYSLRGKLDALIVIEWNKDVEMYDALVKSTSNDLHSFVIQVNNRKYGDTRLRGPYKEPYERDKVRLSGGELDFFIVTTLQITALREFQRNHRSPDKGFKPVPTGFEMSIERRKNS